MDEYGEVYKLHNVYDSNGVLVRKRGISCVEQHSGGVVGTLAHKTLQRRATDVCLPQPREIVITGCVCGTPA